ncbi:MAG TPA: flagellar hook-length control protein FliK [Desulfobacteraceae bacterium]|nr:flagellar hook-length control protein FliK [Desulfobacteraceae bacterium]
MPLTEISVRRDNNGRTALAGLKKNQIVEAKVLTVIPPGKAELLIAGKKILADVSVDLTRGETIQLKVTENGRLQVLKLISGSSLSTSSISSLAGALPKENPFFSLHTLAETLLALKGGDEKNPGIKLPVSEKSFNDIALPGKAINAGDVTRIKDLLLSTALTSDRPDGDFLPRLLDRSGLLQEKKLALLAGNQNLSAVKSSAKTFVDQDLKALALRLASAFSAKDPGVMQPLREFAESMEKFQLLNHHTSDSGRYLIPFPVFADNALASGQLFLDLGKEKEKRNKKENRLVKLSLLLNMSRIGPVRMDCSVLKKEISGIVKVSNEAVALLVKTMIPQLEKKLHHHGFQLTRMECRVSPGEELSETALLDAVVKDIQEDDQQGVNIVI